MGPQQYYRQEGEYSMKNNFDERIDQWFDSHRQEMIQDIIRLVRIPSISDPENEVKPFGEACRRVLDEALAMGREHGFETENYEYYVGTISDGKGDCANTIGFWNHLDVVPVGEGWTAAPFEPYEREGYLIGRGVGDNKGPAVGMIYLMQCLQELRVPMKHRLCLYLGCNEEKQMADMEYFTARYEAPALSVIGDSGFPVCYGEKGILEGTFTSVDRFSDKVLGLEGGHASNMIPDRAELLLKNCEEVVLGLEQMPETENIRILRREEGICVRALGTSRHSAFPYGGVNAVYVLAGYMKGAAFLEERDRRIFAFLEDACTGCHGDREGIAFEDEVSGKTTCAGTILKLKDHKAQLLLNIRYSITADSQRMQEQLQQYAHSYEAIWETRQDSRPNYFPKEHPAVKLLTDYYNEATGQQTKAFVMGGGTYARKLPNAFAYGLGGMPLTQEEQKKKAQLFALGHGGAHEPDEALYLRTYFDAVKLFTKAMVRLDDCEF